MVKTVSIKGAVSIGQIGHGLMMMTWKPTPVPDEQAFEAIKAGCDSLPPNTKMLLNSGEFYGMKPRTANLELLARFYEKYPEYAEKTFLSVKGGVKVEMPMPDNSPANLERSVNLVLEKLRGTKKLDLFECARVDYNYPIEETIKVLSGFVKQGKFDYIGMSECSAATLKRANSVHPIAIVEIEVSPWSYYDETKDVIATAKELDILVSAYSPLGRGFLTGKIQSRKDLEEGDFRLNMPRFQEENFKHNMVIADALKALAEKKGVTPAQLCIAWVASLGPHLVPIPGSSHKDRTLENLASGNVQFTAEDAAYVEKVLADNPVQGGRYPGDAKTMHLWG